MLPRGEVAQFPTCHCQSQGRDTQGEIDEEEKQMWWLIGLAAIGALLWYVTMFLLFGWRTIGNGHGLLSLLSGIFLPVLWVIGAPIRPADGY